MTSSYRGVRGANNGGMTVDPADLAPKDFYQHLVRAVVPRPIGWVSTVSADGRANLAPYSFFNAVCANPPTVMFSSTADRDGNAKDSLRNVREVGEFVCNIVSFGVAERMNKTSASLPRGESEFAFAGLTPVASTIVRPPRVAEALVQLECAVSHVVPLGEGPMSAHVVFGRIVRMHADDAVLSGGQIDPAKLDAIGRMGGDSYCRTRERFEMDRPKV